MLCSVSGQTVVHSESSNDSMTTLPRNWLSDIGWPNWFTSRKSGAGRSPRELPRARLGLFIPAASAPCAAGGLTPPVVGEPGELGPEPLLHAARPKGPKDTASTAA